MRRTMRYAGSVSHGRTPDPRPRRATSVLALAGLLLLAACTGESRDELTFPEGCNPAGFTDVDCLLPYPSDVHTTADDNTTSGRRVSITGAAVPTTDDGVVASPFELHPADGFSVGSQIVALFPEPVDGSPLVGAADDLTRSLGGDSPTLLLAADTGEPVLHLAELDPRAADDARRALVIRPLERLREQTRYVVAIRGLRAPGGAELTLPRASFSCGMGVRTAR